MSTYKNTMIRIAGTTFCLFVFVFLFMSCCDIGRYLASSRKSTQDFYCFEENQYTVKCGESPVGNNRYTYEESPGKGRFIYEISISHNERSSVKLNAFKLTKPDDTPIIAKYYVETYTRAATNTLPSNTSWQEHAEAYKKDSLSTKIDELSWELDNLPVLLRDSGERKAHYIKIKAETNEPYSKIESLKVHYDFEVGENRYVSKNIKYKWRTYYDCRPKLW